MEGRSVVALTNAPAVRISVLTGHNLLKPPPDAADSYSVLVNSVSPEWGSKTTDSGINKAFAIECSSDGNLEALNDALQAGKAQFEALNGSGPTYGDHVCTPTFGALQAAGHTAVLHVLGADCSDRPKRFPVPIFTPTGEQTLATVFLAYFRALTRAQALLRTSGAGANGNSFCNGGIGIIQIATGVFSADQPACAKMFALAVRAWAASVASELGDAACGGVRQITMCCGDAAQNEVLVAALGEAGNMSDAEMETAVAAVLIDAEAKACRMDVVPMTHTTSQKAAGTPPDDSVTPFKYPSLAAREAFTLAALRTREVLHFDL